MPGPSNRDRTNCTSGSCVPRTKPAAEATQLKRRPRTGPRWMRASRWRSTARTQLVIDLNQGSRPRSAAPARIQDAGMRRNMECRIPTPTSGRSAPDERALQSVAAVIDNRPRCGDGNGVAGRPEVHVIDQKKSARFQLGKHATNARTAVVPIHEHEVEAGVPSVVRDAHVSRKRVIMRALAFRFRMLERHEAVIDVGHGGGGKSAGNPDVPIFVVLHADEPADATGEPQRAAAAAV